MAGLKKGTAASGTLALTTVSSTVASSFQKDFREYGGAASVLGIVDLKQHEFHNGLTNFYSTVLTSNFDYLLSSNLISQHAKEIESKQIELSNLQITGDGVISDKWDKIENIESRIIEVNEQDVILECLVDYENKTFENRIFPKSLIDGIQLKVYHPVLIKIFTRKNELKFLFIDGTGLVDIAKFNVEYFKDVSFEMFNQKI